MAAPSIFSFRFALLLGALAGVLVSSAAMAQAWPARPVRVVIPFPTGNAADITARTLSDRLGQRLGQTVLVDNRPGAAGFLGMEAVMKSAPDGYTVLVTSLSPFVINPIMFKKLPYDPVKDYQPVALVGWTGMMLVASPSFPANTVAELVALAKASPGKYNYAHIGIGTLSQLTMEAFREATGVEIIGVPYKGSVQAQTDMLGGQVPLMFDGMTTANVQVKAGKLKALAVSSPRRSIFAPGVPTLSESGLPSLREMDVVGWTGLFAPAGTPRAIVDRLNAYTMAVAQSQDIKDRFAAQNLEVFPPSAPEDFVAYIRQDMAKWQRVAKAAKIEPQDP